MRDFLTTLIECSVSMSVLALILMALTPLLAKRYASKWLYYTWLVIAAGLAIPFRFHFHTAWIRADAVPSTIQRVLPGNVGSAAAAAARMDPAGQGSQTIPWVRIAAALWFAGAAAFLLYHGLRHTRFVRMVSGGENRRKTRECLRRWKRSKRIWESRGGSVCASVPAFRAR